MAPVTAYARISLVVQCFIKLDTLHDLCQSLLECRGRETADLIFWCDSPLGSPRGRYGPLQRKVLAFLETFKAAHSNKFASIEIKINDTNRGTCKTCEIATTYGLERNPFVVFTEDDTIFAKDTLEWMQACVATDRFQSEQTWAIAGESIFFNSQGRSVDQTFIETAERYARHHALINYYVEVDFLPSTCFATTRSKWAEFSATRGQRLGDEDVNARCRSEGRVCMMPVTPRVKDVGMLHTLGYSVAVLTAAGVKELKSTYLTSEDVGGDIPTKEFQPTLFAGDQGALYTRFSRLEGYAGPSGGANVAAVEETSPAVRDAPAAAGAPSQGALLAKTFDQIADIAPGAFVPEEDLCYDPAEIDEMGHALSRLLYAPSQIRKRLEQHGVTIVPANAHSEIPTQLDLEASFETPDQGRFNLVFSDAVFLRETLLSLIPLAGEFSAPLQLEGGAAAGQFQWDNHRFSYSDAMAYYAMLRLIKPETVIEVGGGWSTLVADAALRRNGHGRILGIAPSEPEVPLPSTVEQILGDDVRRFDSKFFNTHLKDGDVLHIDSSHTVKHGGDTLHVILDVLPRLTSTTYIHVHDIKLPFAFSLETMRDSQLYWTEQYLLYAYMIGNSRVHTLYGSNYHAHENADLLEAMMHGRYGAGGGSLWFRQDR